MGKHKPSPDRGYKRKEKALRKNTIVFFTIFFTLAIAGLMLVAATRKRPQSLDGSMRTMKIANPSGSSEKIDVEQKVISSLDPNEFTGGIQPVMIYTKNAAGGEEYFFGMGTLADKGNEIFHLVTSEHLLSKNFPSRKYLRIAAMKGPLSGKKMYASRIIRNQKNFKGSDVIIMEIGDTPVPFEAFSDFSAIESGQIYWKRPSFGGKEVKIMQSVLSRKIFDIIGFGVFSDRPGTFLMVIDMQSEAGESGTGFIDETGHMWLLHGGSDHEDEQKMLREYEAATGKKAVGASLLSGPVPINY